MARSANARCNQTALLNIQQSRLLEVPTHRRICLIVDISSIKRYFSRKKKEHPKSDELTINQGSLARRSTENPTYSLNLLYNGTDAGYYNIDFIAVRYLRSSRLTGTILDQ